MTAQPTEAGPNQCPAFQTRCAGLPHTSATITTSRFLRTRGDHQHAPFAWRGGRGRSESVHAVCRSATGRRPRLWRYASQLSRNHQLKGVSPPTHRHSGASQDDTSDLTATPPPQADTTASGHANHRIPGRPDGRLPFGRQHRPHHPGNRRLRRSTRRTAPHGRRRQRRPTAASAGRSLLDASANHALLPPRRTQPLRSQQSRRTRHSQHRLLNTTGYTRTERPSGTPAHTSEQHHQPAPDTASRIDTPLRQTAGYAPQGKQPAAGAPAYPTAAAPPAYSATLTEPAATPASSLRPLRFGTEAVGAQ